MSDFQLFREVNAAVMREKEYEEMQQERSTDVKSAKVKKVNTEDSAILAELKKLNASNEKLSAQMDARVNEMNVIKQDFNHLRQQVAGNMAAGGGPGGGGGFNNTYRSRVPKCPVCQVSGAFCKHCAHCGKEGHKIKDCPEKN